MEAAEARKCDHRPVFGRLDRSPGRRVSGKVDAEAVKSATTTGRSRRSTGLSAANPPR